MSSRAEGKSKGNVWYALSMPVAAGIAVLALPALFGMLASQSIFDSLLGFALLLVLGGLLPAVVLVPIWWFHEKLLSRDQVS